MGTARTGKTHPYAMTESGAAPSSSDGDVSWRTFCRYFSSMVGSPSLVSPNGSNFFSDDLVQRCVNKLELVFYKICGAPSTDDLS